MALGSLAELDTQLVIAQQLGCLAPNESQTAADLVRELRAMTYSLVGKLPEKRVPLVRRPTDHRPLTTDH